MANSVDPLRRLHQEPSYLDLDYLQKYLPWSTRLKGLNICFLELAEEFPRDSKRVTVNVPSVFESLRYYCPADTQR